MKTYLVTIRAVVTKTYVIDSDNKDSAVLYGHEIFTTQPDHAAGEDYDEQLIDITEVTA